MVQPPVPDNFEPAATIWTNAGITTTAINGIISISRNRVKVICRVLTAAHDLPDRPTFFGELLARSKSPHPTLPHNKRAKALQTCGNKGSDVLESGDV